MSVDAETRQDILTAAKWFTPEDLRGRRDEHLLHIGALINRDGENALVVHTVDQLRDGDLHFGAWVVGTTFVEAEKDYERAFDPGTGAKTYSEYLRWTDSFFQLRGARADRRSGEKAPDTAAEFEGDLDNFKRVNDELGRKIGDFVLAETVQEITDNLRIDDKLIVYRKNTKGDEFGICVAGITYQQAHDLYKRLQKSQEKKVEDNRHEQIWQAIQAAKASCPNSKNFKRYIKVEQESVMVNEQETKYRNLFINGQFICRLRDIAVMDFGFGHGTVKDRKSLDAIVATASAHQDEVKERTHDISGGKYRNN
jgi:diguanylate cyclase (GGDEF)-like protein